MTFTSAVGLGIFFAVIAMIGSIRKQVLEDWDPRHPQKGFTLNYRRALAYWRTERGMVLLSPKPRTRSS